MTIKHVSIYNMELHDETQVTKDLWATRVPGGWLYQTLRENPGGGFDMTSVFVPFSSEFVPKKQG